MSFETALTTVIVTLVLTIVTISIVYGIAVTVLMLKGIIGTLKNPP